ncbi:hypothetical protein KKE60_05830 [Patescibacteria group bacterium]|nr:hypothetical protein [Patescibacteria group bacterium]
MTELFSRVTSGTQVSAGLMVGSSDGVQGINPIIDRLNSITTNNNLIIGSMISGTSTVIYPGTGSIIMSGCFVMEQKTTNPSDTIQGRIWIEL